MTSVDIVIPVHSRERPILRAVRSVIAAEHEQTRALVVSHNIDPAEIRAELSEWAEHPRIRVLELRDGIPSPAGPLNYGLMHSEAEYLGFLGSDDEYQPGALAAWSTELESSPDLLIGQLGSDGAGPIMAPAPRVGRFERLDPVADLLNYRTAPVGVLARRDLIMREGSPGFREGFRIGEDIALGLFLWNYARHIRYSRCTAGYRIREDGADRVTGLRLSPDEIFAPVRDAIQLQPILALAKRRRQAIAVKLLRHQVLERLKAEQRSGRLDDRMLSTAGATTEELLSFAPGSRGFFNAGDTRLIRAVLAISTEDFVAEVDRSAQIPFQRKLIPLNPFRTLAPESFFIRARRTRLGLERLSAQSVESNRQNAV